jgi:hypothetical protein
VLHRDALPAQTKEIFDLLSRDTRLSDYILIGGSALALQKCHRLSEDLDFWIPSTSINKSNISSLIKSCIEMGFDARLTTPQSRIIAARINGMDLLSEVQDYSINGVKVTFFARYDLAYQYFTGFEKRSDKNMSFKIMGLGGIFAMKSHLIHCRTRSRDLFDLMTFVKEGKGIDEILQCGIDADPALSSEYAKSVLRGDVPLDKEDEGFHSVNIKESIADIHQFFSEKIDDYEQRIATCRKLNLIPPGRYIGKVRIEGEQIILHLGRGKDIHFNLNDFVQDNRDCLTEIAQNGKIARIKVAMNGQLSLT